MSVKPEVLNEDREAILEALAGGNPCILIIGTVGDDGELALDLQAAGGIEDMNIIHAFLSKTLRAVEKAMSTDG